jgi:predicted nucleotide-binding protein
LRNVPKIVLVDDDYATEIIVENLGYHGYDARRISSYGEAIRSIDEVVGADLIILDIIMERPTVSEKVNISGDRTTGMALLHAIREQNPKVPVLVFSATNDRDIIDAIGRAQHTTFLSKWNTPSLKDLLSTIEKAIGGLKEKPRPRAFIVHGHDTEEKLALKNYLQNTLGFAEPVILHEQPSFGRTVIEKLEDYARDTDVAFILLTPDDKIFKGEGTNDSKRRARQNVIFELGYFLGVFGRLSGRVLLLHKAPLDLPSDLSGVVYIDISSGVDAAGESIRKELVHVAR